MRAAFGIISLVAVQNESVQIFLRKETVAHGVNRNPTYDIDRLLKNFKFQWIFVRKI